MKINWENVYSHIASLHNVSSAYEEYTAVAKQQGLLGKRIALELALWEVGIILSETQVQAVAREFVKKQTCTTCKTKLVPGKAFTNLVTDEKGNGSQAGKARLVYGLKCPKCGHFIIN